ncbi:DExH-box ATP-dependent RNA helicase DExH10, partial [Bienertia sinuspersici]
MKERGFHMVEVKDATVSVCNGLIYACKNSCFMAVKKFDGDSHRYIGSSEYIQVSEFIFLMTYLALLEIGNKIEKLEQEAATLDASRESEVAEYHKQRLDLALLEKKIMSEITRPERVLYYLLPGRLVIFYNLILLLLTYAKEEQIGAGGCGQCDEKYPPTPPTTTWRTTPCGGAYIVDTLLHCSLGTSENGSRLKPCPPRPREKGEMHVDMGIEEKDIVELVSQIKELEQKLLSHPAHKLQKFRDELNNQSHVLKKLGHINADVVQLKGRATALIDTGDELLVTDLMFN